MSNSSSEFRVLVVQNGARHDYAVPEALARADMLAGFYTDICGNQGLGKWASRFTDLPRVGPGFQRMKNRNVPVQVLPKTRSFPLAAMADQFLGSNASGSQKSPFLKWRMKAAGFCGAKLIYSSLGWAPGFLAYARDNGVKVATEFYVRPSHWRAHQEEYLKYPEWEIEMPGADFNDSPEARRGPCNVSDFLIVPARAVKEDLIRTCEFPADRIHVVPYGVKAAFFEVHNEAAPGNVLFVGSCSIAKGIHYFAQATQLIPDARDGIQMTFTAAGGVTELVKRQAVCSKINFLGRVDRTEVNKLYATADVLVFPTLSDSFGMVMLEAMAAGVPVISSPFCADVVQDGISGFVVDPRDTTALADAIARIVQDRSLRRQMSTAARLRAREYLWENHADKLVQTMRIIAS